MKPRVYIAGKIKGLEPKSVNEKFAAAEKLLNYLGFQSFNPYAHISKLNEARNTEGLPILTDEDSLHRQEILKICISELVKCQHIYLLADWPHSEGALFEMMVSQKVGIEVLELPNYGVSNPRNPIF